MRNKFLIFVFFCFVVIIGFLSCQKSSRGHVEVSGRVLDYFTNDPIQVEVSLMADDATSAKNSTQGTISLASATTNSDGTFNLRSKPSKRGRYYISIYGGVKKEINIQINQNNDLGDFVGGLHVFSCNITVIPRSDSTLQVQKGSLINDYYSFNTGTTATVQNSMTLTASSFNSYNESFPIWYTAKCFYPSYYGTSYFKSVPITSLTGPLTATIYY